MNQEVHNAKLGARPRKSSAKHEDTHREPGPWKYEVRRSFDRAIPAPEHQAGRGFLQPIEGGIQVGLRVTCGVC